MADTVGQTEVEIKNINGLHMKPAMQIVDTASKFASDIKISKDKTVVDAKSIMQVAMLAATCGTKLTIKAKGADAQQAIDALKDLIEVQHFGEQARQPEQKTLSEIKDGN